MAELQALALMNRQDAHTIGDIALDGLRTDGLVPLAHEGIDVGGIILCELVQLVVEGAHIGALLVESMELEDAEESLNEFVERHLQQLGSMQGEGFG